jgi:hypothetical protein
VEVLAHSTGYLEQYRLIASDHHHVLTGGLIDWYLPGLTHAMDPSGAGLANLIRLFLGDSGNGQEN